MKMNKYKNKKSRKSNSMPFLVFRQGSFAVHIGDHSRFGIICCPVWGSFLVWGSFAVGDHWRCCTLLSIPSAFSGVLVCSIDRWNQKKKYDALSNENGLVWTGERFENASLAEKLFSFVSFKMKMGTSENYDRGFTLAIYPEGTPD